MLLVADCMVVAGCMLLLAGCMLRVDCMLVFRIFIVQLVSVVRASGACISSLSQNYRAMRTVTDKTVPSASFAVQCELMRSLCQDQGDIDSPIDRQKLSR